jgi:hypothetical protein
MPSAKPNKVKQIYREFSLKPFLRAQIEGTHLKMQKQAHRKKSNFRDCLQIKKQQRGVIK